MSRIAAVFLATVLLGSAGLAASQPARQVKVALASFILTATVQ